MLGLAQKETNWRLLLLWFVPPEHSEAMNHEAASFRDLLGPDAHRFSWLSYQEFWARLLTKLGSEHREYVDYISARYFPAPLIPAS